MTVKYTRILLLIKSKMFVFCCTSFRYSSLVFVVFALSIIIVSQLPDGCISGKYLHDTGSFSW